MVLMTCIFFPHRNIANAQANTSTIQSVWSKSSPHTDTQPPSSFPDRSVSKIFFGRDQLHSFSLQFKDHPTLSSLRLLLFFSPQSFSFTSLLYLRLNFPAPAISAVQSPVLLASSVGLCSAPLFVTLQSHQGPCGFKDLLGCARWLSAQRLLVWDDHAKVTSFHPVYLSSWLT